MPRARGREFPEGLRRRSVQLLLVEKATIAKLVRAAEANWPVLAED